jgi:hypothetical protein
MGEHYLKQLIIILLMGWFALFAVNQVAWAFVTLTIFMLAAGFVISRFVLGVRGLANLTMSTAGCGSGMALIFWLLFRVLA